MGQFGSLSRTEGVARNDVRLKPPARMPDGMQRHCWARSPQTPQDSGQAANVEASE
jgi:hypothetical protein